MDCHTKDLGSKTPTVAKDYERGPGFELAHRGVTGSDHASLSISQDDDEDELVHVGLFSRRFFAGLRQCWQGWSKPT